MLWGVYFELPGCEQISFHFEKKGFYCNHYDSIWDGKENSTLLKLEACIKNMLKENNLL